MELQVKLHQFEGPLDLLLHLIEKNKIDIYDIPIVEITDQYMEYVSAMEEKDLDVVSEFLVMAATLVQIKARMLLPPEVNEEGEEEDPREELVQQLLEYKMYKYMASELKDRQLYAGKAMYRQEDIPAEVKQYQPPLDMEELIGDLDIQKLHAIFLSVQRRQTDKLDPIRSKFGTIEKDEITLEQKMNHVKTYARRNRNFSFRQLLERQHSRMDMIVTFLSILELMKTGEIHIVQEKIFDDILITSEIAGDVSDGNGEQQDES